MVAAIVAGCGGGTSNFTPVANVNAPFSVSQTATVTSVASPLSLPASGAFGGTVALSAATVPPNEMLTETLTNIAPSTLPALQSIGRAASRSALSVVPASQVLYVLLSSNVTFAQTAPPAFALTLPSADVTAGATYYLALYDPTLPAAGWQEGFAGPATISGTTLSFAPTGKTFTFTPGVQYAFGVYTNTGAAPTPLPTATPTPAPAVVLTSTTTQTYVGGASQAFTASEAGYSGVLTASAVCTNGANSTGTVGTVTPATATPASAGAAVTFTFAPANPGSCVVSVKDASATTGTITFSVSATAVGVN